MDDSEARAVVQQLLKDSSKLQQGAEIVKSKLNSKEFVVCLAQAAVDPSDLPNEQLMSALLLKYVVDGYWETHKIKKEERNKLKEILLENIVDIDSKVAFHLVLTYTNS
jgi:hypothetical protein